MNERERERLIRKLVGSFMGGLYGIFPEANIRGIVIEIGAEDGFWDFIEAKIGEAKLEEEE